MSTFLTVQQFGHVTPAHRATLASLPAILRSTAAGAPDIALTAPDEASIAGALAVSAKVIVVAEPALVKAIGWQQLTDASLVVIPALTLAASLRQINPDDVPSNSGLIHSRLNWQGDARTAILEHLAGLETMVGQLLELQVLSHVSGGYVGCARTAEGVNVTWSGMAGSASPFYELDVVGLSERLEVRAELEGTARPIRVRRGHAGGLDQRQQQYESGLRRFWREVADMLRSGKTTHWPEIARFHNLAESIASTSRTSDERAA